MKKKLIIAGALVLLAVFSVAVTEYKCLVVENKMLRERTTFQKNAIDGYGTQIEELSNTVDELRDELDRDVEHNSSIEGF